MRVVPMIVPVTLAGSSGAVGRTYAPQVNPPVANWRSESVQPSVLWQSKAHVDDPLPVSFRPCCRSQRFVVSCAAVLHAPRLK